MEGAGEREPTTSSRLALKHGASFRQVYFHSMTFQVESLAGTGYVLGTRAGKSACCLECTPVQEPDTE